MSKEKIHIYFVPGLAASSAIFEYIQLPKDRFELHFLEWLVPLSKSESLESYTQRMSHLVQHTHVILIGVSFGGVMVQEMKKWLSPLQTIIISSVKTKHEMPLRMRLAQKTKLHKILPTKAFSNIEKYEKFAFSAMIKRRISLYKKYLSMRDELYLPWAINAIVNWKQETPDPEILHIHGTKDLIFPIENIKDAILVEGGTHIMILDKAKRINTILQEHLL